MEKCLWYPSLSLDLDQARLLPDARDTQDIGEAAMTGADRRNETTFLVALRGWLAVLIVMTPLGASSADLWVDRNSLGGACDDGRTRSQVSETTPWCTLRTAGSAVLPGDTVHVRAGDYTEIHTCGVCNDNSVLQVVVSGTAAQPIRFEAEPDEVVRLSAAGGAFHGVQILETYDGSVVPRFIELAGFEVSGFPGNCVAVKDTSDVVLEDLEITACTGGAIELHRSARVTVADCRVHHNPLGGWTSAIDLYLCKHGNVVRRNFVWANTDTDSRESEGHGLTMDYCEELGGALIESNVIWDNEGWCMAIYHSDGATIRNNTCWQNGLGRAGTGEVSLLGEDATIHNNILVSRDGAAALSIRDLSPPALDLSTISSDFNIVWSPYHEDVVGWPLWNVGTLAEYQADNSQGWDPASLQLDPLLVDPLALDFALQRASAAVDSGDDAHAAALDVTGVNRPLDGDGDGFAVVDRGAYEYVLAPALFADGFESGDTDSWSVASP
ncbi:MAG: right-handed parallel beta-helix repeat-containing protein [Thermoanaerobaculia bacterium]